MTKLRMSRETRNRVRTSESMRQNMESYSKEQIFLEKFEGQDLELATDPSGNVNTFGITTSIDNEHYSNVNDDNSNESNSRRIPDNKFFIDWAFTPNSKLSSNSTSFTCSLHQKGPLNFSYHTCTEALPRQVSLRRNNGMMTIKNLDTDKDSGEYTFTLVDLKENRLQEMSYQVVVKKKPILPISGGNSDLLSLPFNVVNVVLITLVIVILIIGLILAVCFMRRKNRFHRNVNENPGSKKSSRGRTRGSLNDNNNNNKISNLAKIDISLPNHNTLKTTNPDVNNNNINSLPLQQHHHNLVQQQQNLQDSRRSENEILQVNSGDENLPLINQNNNNNNSNHILVANSMSLNSGNEPVDIKISQINDPNESNETNVMHSSPYSQNPMQNNSNINNSSNMGSPRYTNDKTAQLLQDSRVRKEQADKLIAEVDNFLSDKESSSIALGTSATSNPPSLTGLKVNLLTDGQQLNNNNQIFQESIIPNHHVYRLNNLKQNNFYTQGNKQQKIDENNVITIESNHIYSPSKLEDAMIDIDVRESILASAQQASQNNNPSSLNSSSTNNNNNNLNNTNTPSTRNNSQSKNYFAGSTANYFSQNSQTTSQNSNALYQKFEQICPDHGLNKILHAQSLNHFNVAQQQNLSRNLQILNINTMERNGSTQNNHNNTSISNYNLAKIGRHQPPSYEEALKAKRKRELLAKIEELQRNNNKLGSNGNKNKTRGGSQKSPSSKTSNSINNTPLRKSTHGNFISSTLPRNYVNPNIKKQANLLKVAELKNELDQIEPTVTQHRRKSKSGNNKAEKTLEDTTRQESNTTTSIISPTSGHVSGNNSGNNSDPMNNEVDLLKKTKKQNSASHVVQKSMDYL